MIHHPDDADFFPPLSKTGGAGWGSRGSPPLLGLRCPNFFKASWGSWGRLSKAVQQRPAIRREADAIAQSLTEWAREGYSCRPPLTQRRDFAGCYRCKMSYIVSMRNMEKRSRTMR